MTIGEWVHAYRAEHELSMADFAKRTGLSKASIGFLEKGSNLCEFYNSVSFDKI